MQKKKIAIVLIGMLLSTGVQAEKPPKDDGTVICPCPFEDVYTLYGGSACNFSYTETKGKEAEHELTWFDNDGYSYFAGVIKGSGGSYACTANRVSLDDGSEEDLAGGIKRFDSRKAFSVCAAELEAIYDQSQLEVEFCEEP